jgi:hypothetical protein
MHISIHHNPLNGSAVNTALVDSFVDGRAAATARFAGRWSL